MATGTEELRVTLPPSLSEPEARLLLAVKAYEVGRVSLGKAAEMASLSTRSFTETLARHHVPVRIEHDVSEETTGQTAR